MEGEGWREREVGGGGGREGVGEREREREGGREKEREGNVSTLEAISSLSWSIWCDIILSFRFISVISSRASIKFLLHRFLSEHTAS